MENENSRVKKFQVTQSLRMPSRALKFFYYGSFVLLGGGAITVLLCLITGTRGVAMGVAAIAAFLGLIWNLAVHFISENSFGFSRISFGDEYIMFYFGEDKFKLKWADVVECGIEKTRRSYWVYASDHAVTEKEKKEFPENVDEGVFYFNYYWNTWEEFMKFVPEKFKPELEAKKSEFAIQD